MRKVPLRLRIVLGVVAAFAIVVAALALITSIALRGYLTDSVDEQLVGASDRALRSLQGPYRPGPGDAVGLPGQTPGTLAVFIVDGSLTLAGVLDPDGRTAALDDAQRTAIAAAIDGKPIRVEFSADIAGLGAYRLIGISLGDGNVLVMGLPLADVERNVAAYWGLAAAVGGGVLLLAGAGAWFFGATLERTLGRLSAALGAREASEGRLRRFVADASHELRTPLASIRGYAELTRRSGEDLPEAAQHSLGRIESESIRMTGLVEDLLLLARIDEARVLADAPVELGQLVATAVGDAQAAHPDHEWSVDAPDPVVVSGDEPRLHQAVANLLANAAVHTPAGTVVVARVRADGRDAVIEVEDSGPGIPAELLPQIFGRFVRGDASRSRATGSTGLGLAIVEAVASAHGGGVAVESEPGRTIFRIRIPIPASADIPHE